MVYFEFGEGGVGDIFPRCCFSYETIFFLKLNTNDGMEYLKMIARDVT